MSLRRSLPFFAVVAMLASVDFSQAPDARLRTSRLPMRFEESGAGFVARPHGASLVLGEDGATLALPHDVAIGLRVSGGRTVTPRAELPLITKSNYFVGADPAKWRTNVANYGRVVYPSVLDGVDMVYHGEEGQLEYDFVVAPGADASRIAVDVDGASRLSLTASGDLSIETAHGALVQRRPRVYQRDASGRERDVAASYHLIGAKTIGFTVAAYDRARDLVIDPVITYSGYLGGAALDVVRGVAVDAAGSAYVTGYTTSTNFPTKSPLQGTNVGSTEGFVAKLDPSGTSLVYATYFGGTGDDYSYAIAVDGNGSAYVSGYTESADFPVHNALQPASAGNGDIFIVKVAPTGAALAYSSYLGGSGTDKVHQVAVDSTGSLYLGGFTSSNDFPMTGAIQPANAGGTFDGLVAKINAAGSAVVYATYLGGTGEDTVDAISVDVSGNATVAGVTDSTDFPTQTPLQAASAGGKDAFVAKLDAGGTALTYATYLGGTGDDAAVGVASDAVGNVYVIGKTSSTNFPTVLAFKAISAGGIDAFVGKLNPAGSALMYSTYLGGAGDDTPRAIAIDTSGSAYVTGFTTSVDFPRVLALQNTNAGGAGDAYVAKLAPAGSTLQYSTYLGGSGGDFPFGIAVDAEGSAYVGGLTDSTDFPKAASVGGMNAGGSDGFLTKLSTVLLLAPATVKVAPKGTQAFKATGGTGGGYTYDISVNASGAAIDAMTGVYTAGAVTGVSDTVRVKDSAGATATATAMVDVGGVGAPDGGAPSTTPGVTPPRNEIVTNDIDDGCSVAAVGRSTRDAPLAALLGGAFAALALASTRTRARRDRLQGVRRRS